MKKSGRSLEKGIFEYAPRMTECLSFAIMRTVTGGWPLNGCCRAQRGEEMKREVLEVLEKDARATLKQISAMTGLSVRQVRKTIEEAE